MSLPFERRYLKSPLQRVLSRRKMAEEDLINQFTSVTSAPRHLAEQYLARNDGNLIESIEDYYANAHTATGGGSSSISGGEAKKSSQRAAGGIRTFRDLNQEDDEDDDKTNTNFFTGGEKSALQVEDPNKKDGNGRGSGARGAEKSLVDQIFQRAKEQMDQPDDRPSANNDDDEDSEDNTPKFSGSGFKLGDGTEPSTEIKPADELGGQGLRKVPSKVTREIIFWKQGFTVADGPLHRYDDPTNAAVMQELNRGRVPMALLDVEFGQDVDVSVYKKTDEDWTPPKRKVGGFHGQGQRLGSPVPGEVNVEQPQASVAAESVSSPLATEPATLAAPEADEGDSLVQIRFANGKRTSHKFNSSDPVSVVYEFVKAHPDAPSDSVSRPFILSHSFPKKPIEDSQEVTVAEAKLKNAVIVQFWK